MKKTVKPLLIIIVLILLAAGLGLLRHHIHRTQIVQGASISQINRSNNKGPKKDTFNKQKYSINSSSSLWVVVNKARQLPASYIPANLVTPNVSLRLDGSDPEMHLRADAASALQILFAAASKDNIKLRLSSGYRSYADQVSVYTGFITQQGLEAADASSARPGHSEHQTGLAADVGPLSGVCDVQQCFANTPEGQWLVANSYKYGFIIRYQNGTQPIVGYEYEPWHVRYVGTDLATELHKRGQTMEQFFGLPPAANYPAIIQRLS